MPFAENFHPEWGVLAPAPTFMRTVRIVLVATAIGATAGAGTVLALMERPAAEARNPAQPAAALALLATTPNATSPNAIAPSATPPSATAAKATAPGALAPSATESPAAAAALNELNSAVVAPASEKTELASRDGAAATPQATAVAPSLAEPPVPAIAATETSAEKGVAKKRHKTARRRHRNQDAGREPRNDRGYNTAYRQW